MATLEQYAVEPAAVEVFAVGTSSTDLILRKNITETTTSVSSNPDNEQAAESVTIWQCEERQLRVPAVLTAEQVTADFDTLWDYDPRAKTAAQATPTMSERLAAVEAAVLELGEVLASV